MSRLDRMTTNLQQLQQQLRGIPVVVNDQDPQGSLRIRVIDVTDIAVQFLRAS